MSKVYTFNDVVAINLPTGETHYMSPKTARELSNALLHHAVGVENKQWPDQTPVNGNIAPSSETSKHGMKILFDSV